MKKLKRLWLCRDGTRYATGCYVVYVGRKPQEGKQKFGWWHGVGARVCAKEFESSHSIRLAPGDGPVEVEPLKIKKARK